MEAARLDRRPGGGTVERIRSLIPSLIPSEQRVALAVVERPSDVMTMSAADLAERTGTSPATVSRACQNLGFRGFQHLRIDLAGDLARAAQAADSSAEPGVRGRVRGAFDGAARTLQSALGALDFDAFASAADAVVAARRLLIVATGGSQPSAQMFALRCTFHGRSCEAPVDAVVQQLAASTLGAEDVCIAISESGTNSVTLQAAQAAHEAGATVVGVTAYARSTLGLLADLSLVAGASYRESDSGALGGNLVQMLLLGVLQSEAAERMEGAERAEAAAMDKVLDIVANDDELGSGGAVVEERSPR